MKGKCGILLGRLSAHQAHPWALGDARLVEQADRFLVPGAAEGKNRRDIGLAAGLGVELFQSLDDPAGGVVQLLARDARDEEIALDMRLGEDHLRDAVELGGGRVPGGVRKVCREVA